MRNGPSNVIFFASRDKIKSMLPEKWTDRTHYSSYLADFFSGALNGAVNDANNNFYFFSESN